MKRQLFRVVLAAASFVMPSVCLADAGTQLKVFPPEISLRGQGDRQTIAVQLVNDQGITRDVTKSAKLTIADANVITIDGQTLAPKADGETKLLVELGQQKAEVPVVVKDATVSRDVSFRLDVMPIFMKSGCNNGSCHGA
ncbi:MAG TPA: cell surface protein, partial [Planctomycetaceae bacterium]|nr:cell surface protein [Planctomycetaceae bacterium]